MNQLATKPSKHQRTLVDGRSRYAKFAKSFAEGLVREMGGADKLTTSHIAMITNAAHLRASQQLMEMQFTKGIKDEELGRYITLSNALRRLYTSLGMVALPHTPVPAQPARLAAQSRREVLMARALRLQQQVHMSRPVTALSDQELEALVGFDGD